MISKQNPTDLISRGSSVIELIDNHLWFNGPDWLSKCEEEWPQSEIQAIEILERRSAFINAAIRSKNSLNLFDKFSFLSKLIRVIAYCRR